MSSPIENPIGLIGLGPMGRAIATALLDSGHDVLLWNRTAARAGEFLARGARLADSPSEVVATAGVTLVNVLDHDVLDDVLKPADVAGRTVVGLSADTPDRARATAADVTARGGRYLDGAIMTPTEIMGTPDASILLAGPRETYQALQEVLGDLATTTWVGEDPGRAAAFDVALLGLFWSSVGSYLHSLALARAEGIGPGELLPHALGIAGILPPILTDLTERVTDGRHGEASSSMDSIRTSLTHLVAASAARGLAPVALEDLLRQVTDSVARGHGSDEITRLVPS